MKAISEFCEENLYPIWENFCKAQSWSDDLRLQGLNAGQLNLFEGPDYQGAEFELDGKIYHGDVEIHRSTKEWYHHQHHLDRRYNSVQLHLVWHHDHAQSVLTNEKRRIITLDIKKLLRSSKTPNAESSCQISKHMTGILSEQLKHFSLKRLYHKTIRVKNLVKSYSYDQVIFLLLMRMLGSPNNKSNFELLATSIPWEEIVKVRKRNHLTADYWTQYYLMMSGLGKRRPNLVNELDNQLFKKIALKAPPLSISNWQLSGQRPHNHPVRHIKNLSAWITMSCIDSLYFTLKNIINQRQSVRDFLSQVENLFSKSNSNPGFEYHKANNYKWGRSKIIEIVGNALIPFFYWEASMNLSYGFQEYLKDMYFTIPQLSRYAKLNKFERLFCANKSFEKRFYINQGLLYIHQHFCKNGECEHCPARGQHKDIDKNF